MSVLANPRENILPRDILQESRHWELLRKRQAKKFHRSVFRVDGNYVVKKFEISIDVRFYPRPWQAEDACLRLLGGCGAPRSYGWFEEVENGHRVVWLVKEYVPGTSMEYFRNSDMPAIASLMAGIHKRRIFTDDASIGNIIRTLDGHMVFLDFGRAVRMGKYCQCLDARIGRELAKLRREGFRWDTALWNEFLPLYFNALGCSGGRRFRIRAACCAAMVLRILRKYMGGKPPMS